MSIAASLTRKVFARCKRPVLDYLRDIGHRIARVPFLPLGLAVATTLLVFIARTDPYYRYLALEYGIANAKLAVAWRPTERIQIRRRDGGVITSTVGEVETSPTMKLISHGVIWDAATGLTLGTILAVILGFCRSMFVAPIGTHPRRNEQPQAPLPTSPSGGNQQLALPLPATELTIRTAVATVAGQSANSPQVCSASMTEPWPMPMEGPSWTNIHWVAGTVRQDPNFGVSAGNSRRLSFSIATLEYSQEQFSADTRIRTEWHRVVLWDELAERFHKEVAKGAEVIAVGPSRTRKWKDKQGIERHTTELHARMLWIAAPSIVTMGDEAPAICKAPVQPPAKPLFTRPDLGTSRPAKRRADDAHSTPAPTDGATREPQ